MDKMTVNMIAGAVLSCLLVIFGMNTFVDIIYPKGGGPEPEAPGEQQAAAQTAGAGVTQPEAGKSVELLLASANPQAGEAAAKKCATCHSFEKGGASKVGPNLHNVVGRALASAEGFAYSPALKAHGGNWDYKLLDCYLLDPKGCIPGNKMAFAGLKKDSERADVIAYLRTVTENAPPLPAGAAQPAEGAAPQAQGTPAAPSTDTPPAQSSGQAQQQAPAAN